MNLEVLTPFLDNYVLTTNQKNDQENRFCARAQVQQIIDQKMPYNDWIPMNEVSSTYPRQGKISVEKPFA